MIVPNKGLIKGMKSRVSVAMCVKAVMWLPRAPYLRDDPRLLRKCCSYIPLVSDSLWSISAYHHALIVHDPHRSRWLWMNGKGSMIRCRHATETPAYMRRIAHRRAAAAKNSDSVQIKYLDSLLTNERLLLMFPEPTSFFCVCVGVCSSVRFSIYARGSVLWTMSYL